MTALNKADHFLEQVRPTLALTKHRLQPLNHRNYHSSKQLITNGLELQLPKNMADKSKFLQRLLPSIDKQEQKNNNSYRMKLVNQRERSEVLRKNASLKLLRREEEFRIGHKSRGEQIKNLQSLLVREEKEPQSQNSIPLKRGGQLIKRSHNYLRINKKKQEQHQPQKSDVSFEEGLQKLHGDEEKAVAGIVLSQNLLGNGIRKYSSAKLKVFVTNPFEKMMRHQQEIKEAQSHQISPEQAQQFKESQIYQKGDDSCPSTTQQQQLQQLLGML